MYEEINALKILLGKLQGKRPLGRYKHKQEDNFKMDHKDAGWKSMD
jgi:hypothetical protein